MSMCNGVQRIRPLPTVLRQFKGTDPALPPRCLNTLRTTYRTLNVHACAIRSRRLTSPFGLNLARLKQASFQTQPQQRTHRYSNVEQDTCIFLVAWLVLVIREMLRGMVVCYFVMFLA